MRQFLATLEKRRLMVASFLSGVGAVIATVLRVWENFPS